MIIGGSAVIASAAVGGISSLVASSVLGLGTLFLAGGATVANDFCPVGTCSVRDMHAMHQTPT